MDIYSLITSASYLTNLRNNRVARPSGARPPPPSSRNKKESPTPARSRTPAPPTAPATELPPRSESALGNRTRAGSALSNHSNTSRIGRPLVQQPRSSRTSRDYSNGPPLNPSVVVPSANYIERGQRWMEKEEALSLREAMEDLDLRKKEEDEARLFAAAQAEASELVYQHQTGSRPQSPEKPYNYKNHLRKHSYAYARAESVKRSSIDATVSDSSRELPHIHTGSSTHSESPESSRRPSLDPTKSSVEDSQKSNTGDVRGSMGRRRRSSGRRNISGEVMKSVFTGSQIWEEPGEGEEERGRSQMSSPRSKEARGIPIPLTLTERNKVQFAPDPVIKEIPESPARRFHRQEIYKNEPTQSRNPAYTVNTKLPATPPQEEGEKSPTKNGIEIRSDDIRQATSKTLKDRSSKLPTPVMVSDKPGRPIVSFDVNWKPKEADVKPEERDNFHHPSRFSERQNSRRTEKSLPAIPTSQIVPTVPSIHLPDSPEIRVNSPSAPAIPTFSFDEVPAVPSIVVPDAPSISISEAGEKDASSSPTKGKGSMRALPDPKLASSRPFPRQAIAAPKQAPKSHWSLASSRATVSCHQCELPVGAGAIRIEGQRFHPKCIICYQCGTPLGHMDLRGEPDELRGPRLERLKRREAGEVIPDVEGETIADDGDERLRFYCHLDWHELFAPRCHHCKTPIEGTVQSAMGHLYHPGHFFCAECGDPFEAGMTHIEKDGYAWCIKCQTQRTERRAPKCKKCKKPVIGDYVEAMGGEWHADCFRCKNCNGEFDERGIFAREIAGEQVAFCVGCMEKEWKS